MILRPKENRTMARGEFECRPKGLSGQRVGCACLPANTTGCQCRSDVTGRCIRCKCLVYEVSGNPTEGLGDEEDEK